MDLQAPTDVRGLVRVALESSPLGHVVRRLPDEAADHALADDHSVDERRRKVHSTLRGEQLHAQKPGVKGVQEDDVTVAGFLCAGQLRLFANPRVVEKVVWVETVG